MIPLITSAAGLDDRRPKLDLLNNSPEPTQTTASGVSWGAIIAGGAGAAALSLILLILGTGLELSSVSPWAHNGINATTFGVSTILWLTFTQLFASGMGGYLAGRLRTKWLAVHDDEVYFRDTAHGFLAWAVASLMTAALLTSVIGSIIGDGTTSQNTSGATMAGLGIAKTKYDHESTGYFVDSLFRKDLNIVASLPESVPLQRAIPEPRFTGYESEVTRIFMNSIVTGPLPAEDLEYVSQVVAWHTGLTLERAKQRAASTYARMQTKLRDGETAAKVAADKGRKASAYTALWLFISLLIGAFVASYAATIGGRQRDD